MLTIDVLPLCMHAQWQLAPSHTSEPNSKYMAQQTLPASQPHAPAVAGSGCRRAPGAFCRRSARCSRRTVCNIRLCRSRCGRAAASTSRTRVIARKVAHTWVLPRRHQKWCERSPQLALVTHDESIVITHKTTAVFSSHVACTKCSCLPAACILDLCDVVQPAKVCCTCEPQQFRLGVVLV
jgi:hypothetical protein